MALRPGTHLLGPIAGSLQVLTYREGFAQKVGHDLILTVARWEASVEVAADGSCSEVRLDADPGSLEVTDGRNGIKPLSARDREEIRRNIDQRVLQGRRITFASSRVDSEPGSLSMTGELSLGDAARAVAFDLALGEDGRLQATLPVVQSHWSIKPYSALMGALKVRDAVDVVLDVQLPVD